MYLKIRCNTDIHHAVHTLIACFSFAFDKTLIEIALYLYLYSHKVGVRCLETGVWGAYYNILINLLDIKDETYKEQVR